MRVATKGGGHAFVEFLLDGQHSFPERKAGAVADAEDMGIDGKGFLTKGRVHNDVGGLSPDTGQGRERIVILRHLSAEIAHQNG